MDLVPQLSVHHAAFAAASDLLEARLLVGPDGLQGFSFANMSFRFRVLAPFGSDVQGLELARV